MRAALLLVLAVPTLAFAQAGRFLLAAGDVTIVRGSQQIPASIGSAVAVGDTVRLGARSGAQIRMSDETIVALRSNTIFRIDEHVFSGQGDENDRSVFSLLKGGMRAVTGALARQPGEGLVRTAAQPAAPSPAAPAAKPGAKPAQPGEDSEGGLLGFIRAPLRAVAGAVAPTKHSVRLPTATVGIRGTHYTLVHCDNDCYVTPRTRVASAQIAQSDTGTPGLGNLAPNGSYGGVSDGRIGIVDTNREFGANEFFHIAPDGSIQSLIGPPSFLYDTLEAQERNRDQNSGETTAGMAGSGLNAESRPSDTPTPPTPAPFIVTEQRNTGGDPIVLAGSGPTPNTAFLSAFNNATGGPSTVAAFVDASALNVNFVSGDGFFTLLTAFAVPAGSTANPATGGYAGATGGSILDESFPNSVGAFWGRWFDGSVGDASGTTTINSQAGNVFHYLVGPNTPPEIIAAKTASVGFDLVQGTDSFSNNAGDFGSLSSGRLIVNFTARTVTFPAMSVSFSPSGQNWTFSSPSTSPITIQPGQGAFVQNTTTGTCAGGTCTTSSNAALSRTGAFMGPVGDHLGIAFHGRTTGGTGTGTMQGTGIFACPAPC